MNYYNEWDKDAAAWLRELIREGLIPKGDVDDRSITEVKAHELTSYSQCHFFAGIGGWPLAFQLAGIDPNENADSGSCPCQPFSGTGKQMGFADPRHLWPAFRRIENRRGAATIYGEQVASKLGREWLARVFSDLEIMGYAGSGADLCSAGVGSPNIRQRLYWVGDAVREGSLPAAQRGEDHGGESRGARDGISAGSSAVDRVANPESERCGETGSPDTGQAQRTGRGCSTVRLEHAQGDGWQQRWAEPSGRCASGGCEFGRLAEPDSQRQSGFDPLLRPEGGGRGEGTLPEAAGGGAAYGVGHADHARREGRLIRWYGGYQRAAGQTSVAGPATLGGFWGIADLVFCRDGRWRRIESGSFPLAHGIPSRVGPLLTELRKLGKGSISLARANRNIRLKGYGNAINPWIAAAFVRAHRDGAGVAPVEIMDLDP